MTKIKPVFLSLFFFLLDIFCSAGTVYFPLFIFQPKTPKNKGNTPGLTIINKLLLLPLLSIFLF